jgi:type IV pilus assembly protein PilC
MTPPHAQPALVAFTWKGLDPQGKPVQGRLHAINADLARAQLRRQGLQQIRLQRLWWHQTPSVRPKELAAMTRQLAALLRAGVPLLQALDMLCRSMASPALLETMRSVQSDVESGLSLHTALAKHPLKFSGLYIHMAQAGEAAGILESMMERLALTLEKNEALRSKIRSALMYPCAVLLVAIGILLMILIFVVPVFQDVFQSFGAELPWATQMVVGLSTGLIHSGPFVLVMAVSAMWLTQKSKRQLDEARQRLSSWLLRWPVLGPLVTQSVVARWAQTLSALLSAGVPLTEALGPTAQACDHQVYAHITQQLQRRVGQGSSLSEAMGQTGHFPAMIVQLCATGEETGSLDSLLARAAELMETELDDQINGLSSLLEPLIIVVLGGFIGAILVAMYLPIFRLGQVF